MASKSRVLGGSLEVTNFSDIKNCPECGSLWHDQPIPEKSRHLFGGAEWFSRVIGVYSSKLDRTIAYKCPDCSTTWNRDTGAIFDYSFFKP
jgi:predicted  nucleic acid-binding Zn ribbon protein